MTNIILFSMHNIDEMLEDIGINVSAATRAFQWLWPINPLVCRKLPARLLVRQGRPMRHDQRTSDSLVA